MAHKIALICLLVFFSTNSFADVIDDFQDDFSNNDANVFSIDSRWKETGSNGPFGSSVDLLVTSVSSNELVMQATQGVYVIDLKFRKFDEYWVDVTEKIKLRPLNAEEIEITFRDTVMSNRLAKDTSEQKSIARTYKAWSTQGWLLPCGDVQYQHKTPESEAFYRAVLKDAENKAMSKCRSSHRETPNKCRLVSKATLGYQGFVCRAKAYSFWAPCDL
jgi:hypothetical protein